MKTNKIGLLFLCLVAVIVLAVMVKDHDKNTAVSEYDHENPYFYTTEQTNTSEDITISENRNMSETESVQVQETEETADWINAIIQQNNARIADHLYNFPAEQKWIDIGLFDFTNDGKEELLLSKTYVAAGGGAALFSYYYVYDQQGNELFTFLGGSRDGMHIYADYDKLEFYISSPALHWGAHNDMELCSKIAKRERWEKDFFIAKWDMRSSIEYDDRCLCEFRIPLSYEETLFYNSSEKWVEVRDNTEFRLTEGAFEAYLRSFENLQEFPINIYGIIYCLDGKIIAELGDRQTELETNKLSFPLQENIICVYEGLNNSSQLSAAGCIAGIYDTYVIYRETQENDIRFVNLLYSAQETGDLYAWKDQYLVPIVEQETGDFYVWNDGDLVLIGTREEKQQGARENPKAKPQKDLPRENMTESELLEQTMYILRRAGYDETNLIYDGTRHFLNRTYDVVSGFDDFPDHIIRGQEYYIDRETKNVYRVEEEAEFLRTELYYIDTLQ